MSNLSHAIALAELGYPVFPCRINGKEPATPNGLHDATLSPDQIERWWATTPNANIGLCTEGMLVVDVDGRDNAWLRDQPDRLLELSVAPMQQTPSGGRHYFFRQPAEAAFRNTVCKIAPKVDTRANGGYVLVPPSMVNDAPYSWCHEAHLSCSIEQLPEPPGWLLQMLVRPHDTISRATSGTGSAIPQGSRNSTLTSLAGMMRRYGMTQAEMLAALHVANHNRCQPSLPSVEVERIALSVGRYQPDLYRVSTIEGHGGGFDVASDCDQPVLLTMSEVEARSVDWLWLNRIAVGRLTLLVGMPGCGKSFLTCDAAARVSTGRNWPDGTACSLGSVILISAEDDPHDTIRPRLDAHSADVSKIHLLTAIKGIDKQGKAAERVFTLADLPALESALRRFPDCRLVVIDPIGSYLGGRTDAHRDNEVRAVLAPLAKLAQDYGVAVLIVAHRRKGSASLADDTALGSRAFTGIARSVWHLSRDPNDKHRRLLLPGKSNLAAEPDGLAFEIAGEPAAVTWEAEPVTMNADDALHAEQSGRGKEPPESWLLKVLSDGPKTVTWLEANAPCSKRTLERIKGKLGIVSKPGGFGEPWVWSLPTIGQQAIASETADSGMTMTDHNMALCA